MKNKLKTRLSSLSILIFAIFIFSFQDAYSQCSVTTTNTDVTCFGACNGTAFANPSGGTSPYTYNWAPGGETDQSINNLCPGSYTVTTTDAAACTATETVFISEPAPLTPAITSINNLSCNGSCDGSATISVSGGNSGYTYNWAPGGQTSQSATSLCAGSYTATITDAAGCTASLTVFLTQPAALNSSISMLANPSCNGSCDGSATVTASGGTFPYTYFWDPIGQTGATSTGLCGGNYTVTVADGNGCTSSATISLSEPPSMNAVSTSTSPSCPGSNDGSITINVSGGNPPYQYNIDGGAIVSAGNSYTFTGLSGGVHSITVYDTNGCTISLNTNVPSPPGVYANITKNDATCSTCADGSATISAGGGTQPFTYNWSPTGGTGPTAANLIPGTYTGCVTDGNGCSDCDTVTIGSATGITSPNLKTSFHIYPNPATDRLIIEVKDVPKVYSVSLVNMLGQTVYQENSSEATFKKEISLENLSMGVYTLIVRSGNERFIKQIVKAE